MKRLLCWAIIPTLAYSTLPPLVDVPNLGKIRGFESKSFNGRAIYSFQGVPYARPPLGKYRFKEPVPIKPWKGIWEAKTLYRCMQYDQYTPGPDRVVGDENCLYLNIYTPNLDYEANLDVIVYIHGGSFMFNSGGLYHPDYLLDHDVILITLNYRLGPLGFLSTEDNTVPGNNGVRDQILALQFIKEHVKNFGGNPDSITIVGNSAGGASVNFHYFSPKSRGLFHRGWSQSGTTLNPWVLMEQPLEKTKKMASNLGCLTNDNKKMIECLKNRPARQIVASVKGFQPWLYLPFSPFGLVVDGWASDPVLPQHPFELIKNGLIYDVPWLISHTNSEGLYPAEEFYSEEYLKEIDSRWNELIPLILDYNYTVDPLLQNTVSQRIREYYMGVEKLTKSTFRNFLQILSDRLFLNGIYQTVKLEAKALDSPIYLLQFSYRGRNSWFKFKENNQHFGAAHADDGPYIFKIKALDTSSTENDRAMVKLMVELLVSFAQNGKPKVPIEWPVVSKEGKIRFLQIDGPGKMSIGEEDGVNREFWDALPILENDKLFPRLKDEL